VSCRATATFTRCSAVELTFWRLTLLLWLLLPCCFHYCEVCEDQVSRHCAVCSRRRLLKAASYSCVPGNGRVAEI
jgi:hypothetical protein